MVSHLSRPKTLVSSLHGFEDLGDGQSITSLFGQSATPIQPLLSKQCGRQRTCSQSRADEAPARPVGSRLDVMGRSCFHSFSSNRKVVVTNGRNPIRTPLMLRQQDLRRSNHLSHVTLCVVCNMD